MVDIIPRAEYPRPDFQRTEWLNLNGEWNFEFDDNDCGESEEWYENRNLSCKIVVPFCYQSKLSGINDKSCHDIVWYKRKFLLPENFKKRRVFLSFGAVDFYSKVWVNGKLAGVHSGGYTSFKFDITNALKESENEITVRVEDKSFNRSQLRGKQSWRNENFGCWYTRVTGIWQTVWLEAVRKTYIEKVKLNSDIDRGCIDLDVYIGGNVEGCSFCVSVYYGGIKINETESVLNKSNFSITIDIKSDHFIYGFNTWSPDSPNLYDIKYEIKKSGKTEDLVKSYFGMRKVSTKNGYFMLNNVPVYQRLVLDQGYYNGGLLTAANDDDYIYDIKMIKKLGFNGVRMHQKAEDPRFLYWADKLGILVWGEMGSAYEFNDNMMYYNFSEWMHTVERDYNHPSVIAWTLMNESWGVRNLQFDKKQQYHTLGLYYMIKSYDSTRLIISNDGWEHTVSDIITFHNYTQNEDDLYKQIESKESLLSKPIGSIGNTLGSKFIFADGYKYNGQPIMLSECGGVAYDEGSGWGYGESVKTEEEFLNRYRQILGTVYKCDYISGFCCTQLTDVEQEINGLMTSDRKLKINAERFADIIKRHIC